MRGMSARYRHARRRPPAPRCGRPTQKGTPCKLSQEVGRGCRHHATRAEREAVAAEAEARAERAKQRADRERRTIRAGLGLVTLTLLAGLGSCAWVSWKDDQDEAACRPHRTQARALSDKARAVRVPLVLSTDPSILHLQLGIDFPDNLGDLGATSATEMEISAAYSDKRELAGQAAQVVLQHRECFGDLYIGQAARIQQAPAEVSQVVMPSPAHCRDGWPSTSIGRQGACSHHGGVVPGSSWATLLFS
jgi:hypothetical protein